MYDSVQERKAKASKVATLKSAGQSIMESGAGAGGAASGKIEEKKKAGAAGMGATQTAMK